MPTSAFQESTTRSGVIYNPSLISFLTLSFFLLNGTTDLAFALIKDKLAKYFYRFHLETMFLKNQKCLSDNFAKTLTVYLKTE
jgi:hypothetical protein